VTRHEALNRLRAVLEARVQGSVTVFPQTTEPALRRVLSGRQAHYYRLAVEDESYGAFADERFVEELLNEAAQVLRRRGVDLYACKLGLAICGWGEDTFEDLARIYPDIPRAQQELILVATT
jgi:hypothetical protein